MAKTTPIPCPSLSLQKTWLTSADLLSTTVVLGDSGRRPSLFRGLACTGSHSVGEPVRGKEDHQRRKKRPDGRHVVFRAVDEFLEAKIELVGHASGPLHCIHALEQVGESPALRFLRESSPQVVKNTIVRGLGALAKIWEIGVHWWTYVLSANTAYA